MTRAAFVNRAPVQLDRVPHELRQRRRWVMWKGTKVPHTPESGRKASVTDPTRWGSFADAVKAYRSGQWDGIGIVLEAGDELVAFDFDKCRDPLTGELDASVHAELVALGTYAEISPSGTGVHAFILGTLPAWWDGTRPAPRREIYTQGRYLTVTGHVLEEFSDTIARDEGQLEQWCRRYQQPPTPVPTPPAPRSIATSSRTGDEILRRLPSEIHALYASGDLSAYGGDHSSADLALCNALAWRTDDPEQIDSLFRDSALMRPKWDEKRGSSTYGERTITKALKSVAERRASSTTPSAGVHREAIPIGGDSAELIADLRRQLEAERQRADRAERRAELERQRADQAEALNATNAELVTALTIATRCKATVGTAANVMPSLVKVIRREELRTGQLAGGVFAIPLERLGDECGLHRNTIARSLKALDEIPDSPLTYEAVTVMAEQIDPDTGELFSVPRKQARITLDRPITEAVAWFAQLDPSAKPKPKAVTRERRCPDHPSAGVVLMPHCDECGRNLALDHAEALLHQNSATGETYSTPLSPRRSWGLVHLDAAYCTDSVHEEPMPSTMWPALVPSGPQMRPWQ